MLYEDSHMIYLQNSCAGCHNANGKGHLSNIITRFGYFDGNSMQRIQFQKYIQVQSIESSHQEQPLEQARSCKTKSSPNDPSC